MPSASPLASPAPAPQLRQPRFPACPPLRSAPFLSARNEVRPTPLRQPRPVIRCPRYLRLRSFAPVGIPRALDRRRNRILVLVRSLFAAFNQIVRSFPQFPRFLLRIVAPLVGTVRQKSTRLFARLRRKQHAHQRANSHPHQKVSNLGSHVVRHDSLQNAP